METYDPFPRPGDPKFTGFPKHLSEDVISYSIFLPRSSDLTPPERRSRLSQILVASQKLAATLLKGFIWQRDSFNLKFDDSASSFLHGVTQYGDSITDEWIIVYLLRELSRAFEDAWIRVSDQDGEFLLIEAANALPKWLDPDIADHRVWINSGNLYLIHPPLSDGEVKNDVKSLSLDAALLDITTKSSQLLHAADIEKEAFQRLDSFPSAIAQSMHRRRMLVPRKLAHVLHRLPYTSSAAVEAFFLRNKDSSKILEAGAYERLRFPPNDLVQLSVQFNKVSYAQLVSQEFSPPLAWAASMQEHQLEQQQQLAKVGMKLTCGFEIMMADSRSQSKRPVREVQILLDDLEEGDEALPSDSDMLEWPDENDDDSWLDVNFEDFQAELSGHKASGDTEATPALKDEATQKNFKRIVDNFEKFLADDEAGLDGAENAKHFEESGDEDLDEIENDESDDDQDEQIPSSEWQEDLGGFDMKRDGKAFAEAIEMLMAFDDGGYVDKRSTPRSAGKTRTGISTEIAEHLPDHELSSDDDDDEDFDFNDLQQLTEQMEAELRKSGELPSNESSSAAPSGAAMPHDGDPRFALAKNLLESMKHSGGQGAGPTASMLASMGLTLPRDEDKP